MLVVPKLRLSNSTAMNSSQVPLFEKGGSSWLGLVYNVESSGLLGNAYMETCPELVEGLQLPEFSKRELFGFWVSQADASLPLS